MPLRLTLEQAEIWDQIKTGQFNHIQAIRYNQKPEQKLKDEKIEEMLQNGYEKEEIREALKTSEKRIQRITSELIMRGESVE